MQAVGPRAPMQRFPIHQSKVFGFLTLLVVICVHMLTIMVETRATYEHDFYYREVNGHDSKTSMEL